jgi:hypothetical protein
MITPSSSHGFIPVPASLTPRTRPATTPPAQDRISLQQHSDLKTNLKNELAIRPEVVARGRLLAADPTYPPAEIINDIANLIANSDDPSLAED